MTTEQLEQLALAKRILAGREWLTFDELSDKAKARAVENYCQHLDYWDESIRSELRCDLEKAGVYRPKLSYSGFSSQGDGAHFTGDYSYAAGWRSWFGDGDGMPSLYEAVSGLAALQARYFYQLQATITHRGHYQHENCTRIDVYRRDDKAVSAETAEELAELLRDLMRACYKELEAEYDYSTGEGAYETLSNSEDEFHEDGRSYTRP